MENKTQEVYFFIGFEYSSIPTGGYPTSVKESYRSKYYDSFSLAERARKNAEKERHHITTPVMKGLVEIEEKGWINRVYHV